MGKQIFDSHAIPLQGGVDLFHEKVLLPNGSFSQLQNFRQLAPGLEKRKGQKRLHTTTDKTNIPILSSYEIIGSSGTPTIVFNQYADGSVHKTTTMPPTGTTGNFGTEVLPVLSDVTGLLPASWEVFGNMLFFADGVRTLQIMTFADSEDAAVTAFIVYKGTATIPELIEEGGYEITTEITSDDGYYGDISSLEALGSYDCLFVCFPMPVNKINWYMNTFNGNTATMAAKYRTLAGWTAVSGFADGTSVTSKSLNQNGASSWTLPTDESPFYAFGRVGFWYQISFSAALDSDVKISYIRYSTDNFISYLVYPTTMTPVETVNIEKAGEGKTSGEPAVYESSSDSISLAGLETGDYLYLTTLSPIAFLLADMLTPIKNVSITISTVVIDINYYATSTPRYTTLTGPDWADEGFSAGQYMTISDCATSGVNGTWKIYSIIGTVLYLTDILANVATGDSMTFATAETISINTIEMYSTTGWSSALTFTDGTDDFAKTGIILINPGSNTAAQTTYNGYYGYTYRLALTGYTTACTVGLSYLPIGGISLTDSQIETSAALTCKRWANRMCYSFKDIPYVFISKTETPLTIKNDSDTDQVPIGDGKDNDVLALVPFGNDLMVFQEELGVSGGAITYIKGYSPYFSTSVRSPVLGIFNQKCAYVYTGAEMKEIIDFRPVQTALYFLNKKGLWVMNYDGFQAVNITGTMSNYFDAKRSECVRKGYEKKHFLSYDADYDCLIIGIVSGASATVPNVFLVYNVKTKTWATDKRTPALSSITTIQGAGDTPSILLGGGQDGFLYQLNKDAIDHTTAIEGIVDIEIDGNGRRMSFNEDMLVCKAQAAGNVERSIFVNGKATAAETKNFSMISADSASYVGKSYIHQGGIVGNHFTVRYKHNTANEDVSLLKVGYDISETDSNVRF